jgi:hypothetical protein
LTLRKEAEEPIMRFVVRSIPGESEIDLKTSANGSSDTRNYASEKSDIRCVVDTPDAKNPKPRPPLKPDFDRPVRLIVNL